MKHHFLQSIILGVWLAATISSCTATRPVTLAPTPALPQPTATFQPSPTPCPKVETLPQISWLETCPEYDAQGHLIGARYRNAAGIQIAAFDVVEKFHNNQVTWQWAQMTRAEKDFALRWIFDPQQMRYVNFQDQENWVIQSITRWIPRINAYGVPSDPQVAIHWQADGPPMSETTLYEALSRIKSLALVPERRMCNYGHSHLGLIEYGGETILFTSPGWQKVSAESREIFTTLWTIKEALVIYYPQTQGWSNSCPSDTAHLQVEYYSTIWLLAMEQMLAQFVTVDKFYWVDQEIPFQIKNIMTQKFPECRSPASTQVTPQPSPTPCSSTPK